jgi:hypothetical protein
MDILKLYRDFHIDHSTEHKNVRDGWVGTDCPFCGSTGKYHFGYCMDENYFSCWQCGGHGPTQSVARLLGVSTNAAVEIMEQYNWRDKTKTSARVKVGTNKFGYPKGDIGLGRPHKAYLKERKFNWEYLQSVWGVTGTGPVAKLDDLNYANRILAPIFWDGRIVSFQTRDITGRHSAKYMACPPEREVISHKHVLYGRQGNWEERGICVEGIFDAWRMGTKAFATFGVKFTRHQIRAMAKHFKEIAILYDPEEQAQEQARKLVQELSYKGVKAWTVDLRCDPADLTQDEANELISEILT